MLPFLKPKKASATVYANSDTKSQPDLKSIAEALIKHVQEGSVEGVAECLSRLEKRDEANEQE